MADEDEDPDPVKDALVGILNQLLNADLAEDEQLTVLTLAWLAQSQTALTSRLGDPEEFRKMQVARRHDLDRMRSMVDSEPDFEATRIQLDFEGAIDEGDPIALARLLDEMRRLLKGQP